jgi:hypothetical protein
MREHHLDEKDETKVARPAPNRDPAGVEGGTSVSGWDFMVILPFSMGCHWRS